MPKHARDLPFPALAVDPAASRPLHRQIYFAIREAILGGPAEAWRAPAATRALAGDLCVSRNTVMAALRAAARRGLHRRPGRRRLVRPDDLPDEAPPRRRPPGPARAPRAASRRAAPCWSGSGITARGRAPFSPGLPELDAVPVPRLGPPARAPLAARRSAPSWSAASPAATARCARPSPTISPWRAPCSAGRPGDHRFRRPAGARPRRPRADRSGRPGLDGGARLPSAPRRAGAGGARVGPRAGRRRGPRRRRRPRARRRARAWSASRPRTSIRSASR